MQLYTKTQKVHYKLPRLGKLFTVLALFLQNHAQDILLAVFLRKRTYTQSTSLP